MRHWIRRLSLLIAVVWRALIAICAVAGLLVAAVILLLIPAPSGVVVLFGLVVHSRRQPRERHVAAWFDEKHHIGQWHRNG